ncbi:MAG: beta-propeller fold lactonase family protein [Planctomycetota bacterium]
MPNCSPALPALLASLALAFSACSDSTTDETSELGAVALGAGGGGPAGLSLGYLSNGFDQLLPHRVAERDGLGAPTGNVVEIRSLDTIRQNVDASNPVLPTPAFPSIAALPSGEPGNQYFVARFAGDPDPASVFDLSGSAPALTEAVAVTAYDPASNVTTDVPVRVFVGGITAIDDPAGARLQRWAAPDPVAGRLRLRFPEADGFPGSANGLADPRAILVVADSDGDLSTLETFPAGVQLGLAFRGALRTVGGEALEDEAFVATTVGPDGIAPAVALDPMTGLAAITPEDGATDVDPETDLTVRFTEPVQPASVAVIEGTQIPVSSPGLRVVSGPPTQRTLTPVAAIPFSPYDLAHYRVVTGFPFFGTPPGAPANAFSTVDVTVEANGGATDLAVAPTAVAMETQTQFVVGSGTGIVNAPVVPVAVYLLRNDAAGGALSVVDLDGFGQSTGNPVTGSTFPGPGETRFPFDPNVALNPTIRPLLVPGTSSIDGGSAGVFRLTLDASLQDRAVFAPTVVEATDLHIGQPLDRAFRNGPPPFGCLSGGGNVCSLDGLKLIVRSIAPDGGVAPGTSDPFGALEPGYGNLVSWAPHPNPPRLTFPPLCVAPLLAANEPTAVTVVENLLVPGVPFADPAAMLPPTGKLARRQNAFFGGPSFGPTQAAGCDPYIVRQQIGHFLYVADRARSEVVVLNSNRLTVIERIPIDGATDLAMHPNLSLLAVSQPRADAVTFVDVDPASATFHDVVSTVAVGDSPRGIAWQPEAEDLVVCCEGDRTLHLVSGLTLQTRKVVSTGAYAPFDVAIAPRQVGFSFSRAVYFAYVLTREGAVVLFESGPDGVNGWGYDDVVGTLPLRFGAPKAIQPASRLSGAGVYVAHEGPIDPSTGLPGALGDGAISRVEITSAIFGILPLVPGSSPEIRDLEYEVTLSIAESAGQLTGIPVDLGFDDLSNRSALPGQKTSFSVGLPLPANGKAIAVGLPGQLVSGSRPNLLFAAVPDSNAVDVVQITAAGAPRLDVDEYLPGVQSIRASGTTTVTSYWRQ